MASDWKRTERLAAKACREQWNSTNCRRSAQVSGTESSDLTDALAGGHAEVKGYHKIAAARFLDQAIRDAKPGEVPFVLMKEDRGEFLVLLRMRDSVRFSSLVLDQISREDYEAVDERN